MKPNPLSLLATLLLISTPSLRAETLAETLERGVFLQETRNDPASAVPIYQTVIDHENRSREVASEARYRLAMCLIALGDEAKGRAALETLAADTGADPRWATKAAAGLAKTRFVHPAPWKSGEVAIYQLLGPAKQNMGFMIAAVEGDTAGDDNRWTSYFVRGSSEWGISRVSFSKDTFDPVEARFFMDGFGDFSSEFAAGGAVTVTNHADGKVTWERKAGESALPMFDNDQVIQLLRVLPQTIGTKVQSEIVMPFNPAPIAFTMEVAATEMVETDAGDFDCVKIVSNIGQDFWVSRAEDRRLIKMKMGVATLEAAKFHDWNPGETTEYVSSRHGIRLAFPAGVLWGLPDEKEKGLRVHVYPTDFSAFGGILSIRTTVDLPESGRKSSQSWAKADLAEGAKLFEEYETVHEAGSKIGGRDAWVSRTRERRGQVASQTWHIHSIGPDKSVTLRLAYPAGGEEEVEKLATRLIEGISLK